MPNVFSSYEFLSHPGDSSPEAPDVSNSSENKESVSSIAPEQNNPSRDQNNEALSEVAINSNAEGVTRDLTGETAGKLVKVQGSDAATRIADPKEGEFKEGWNENRKETSEKGKNIEQIHELAA